jgi:hypothetical protein
MHLSVHFKNEATVQGANVQYNKMRDRNQYLQKPYENVWEVKLI